MSTGQLVTAADLVHDWTCEACSRPFTVGDEAYGVIVAVTSDGTPIEGEWACEECWRRG